MAYRTFIQRYLGNISIGLIVLLVLFCGALIVLGYIIHEVFWEKEFSADLEILSGVQSLHTLQLTRAMRAVTFFASGDFLMIAYLVLAVFYLFQKKRRRAIEIAFIGIGGSVITYFMKNFFQRARPADPLIDPLKNFSFPSGHSSAAFIFYGLLIYLISKTKIALGLKILLSLVLGVFALIIGFSRIYLRVHYPSDVIAGFCIGCAWLSLCIWYSHKAERAAAKPI